MGVKLSILVMGIFLISFVSAGFGFDNTDVPSLRIPITTGGDTINNYYNVTGGNGTVDYSNVALTNQSNDFGTFNQTTTGFWEGLFNWVINAVGSSQQYLQFDGETLTFNEAYLNATIDARAGGIGGNASWNETRASDLYVNITGDTMTGDLIVTDGTYNVNISGTTISSDTAYAPLLQLGLGSNASGDYSVAIGLDSKASGTHGVAIGNGANAVGVQGTALGSLTYAGYRASALGYWAVASGDQSIAIGDTTYAPGNNSVAIGTQSISRGKNSFALGSYALAEGNYSFSIGTSTNSSGLYSFAFGRNVTVGGDNSFGFGLNGLSDLDNTFNLHNLDLIVDGNITTESWFNGLFNWSVLTNWLSFDGGTLSFNETKLNETGDKRWAPNTTRGIEVLINDTIIFLDTNASKSCNDGDYLGGGIDGCRDMNDTIDERTASVTYLADNCTVDAGTYTAGNESSSHFQRDDNILNVTEGMGTVPVLIVVCNYSNVLDFNRINLRELYTGSSGHELAIGLWDPDDGIYEEEYGDITDQTNFQNKPIDVLDSVDHITDDGNVSLRFRHIQNGISSHTFSLDYAVLVDGFTSLVSNTHDSLSGRDDISNHPWALDTAATRDITGNLTILGRLNISSDLNATNAFFAGNVGIGTSSPNATLHLNDGDIFIGTTKRLTGANGHFIVMGGTKGNSGFELRNSASRSYTFQSTASGTFVIQSFVTSTGGIDKSYITLGSSKMGVLTTSPDSTLSVKGNAAIGLTYAPSNAAPTDGLIVEGDVGIGTATPTAKLSVNGTGALLNITNGTDVNFFVDGDSGFVGIGTDSPSTELEIKGSTYTLNFGGSSGREIASSQALILSSGFSQVQIRAASGNVQFVNGGSGAIVAMTISAGGTLIFNTENANTNVVFRPMQHTTFESQVGSVHEIMRIDGINDRIGIGTATPTTKLEVNGTSNFTEDVYIGDDLLMPSPSSRIGIGTDNPGQTLEVIGAGLFTTGGIFGDGTNNGNINLDADIAGMLQQGVNFLTITDGLLALDRDMILFRNTATTTEYARFNSDGDFGIGTDNPGSLLHIFDDVAGTLDIRIENQHHEDSTSSIRILTRGGYTSTSDANMGTITFGKEQTWTSSSSTRDSFMGFSTTKDGSAGSNQMVITSDGFVGIGTASPDMKLQVIGDVKFGDDNTNYVSFGINGDQTFVGTAGFYPRTLEQGTQPTSGTGVTQVDDEELIIWIDDDDGDRTFLLFNTDGTVLKIELT